ncbi:unnamed protein product [Ilex paraguariensis]|uniref:K-box domain-containing protein n=1 Tax=Ilex paraguariensis TaxID=185542 RepID=A0ABC8S0U5_9AQUA
MGTQSESSFFLLPCLQNISSDVPLLNACAHLKQNSYHEYLKLKARVDVLQQSQRNLLGEDLGPLNTKDLERLEHQLEKSLKQIRSTKTQGILDQLAELQRREKMLAESNSALRRMTQGILDQLAELQRREKMLAESNSALRRMLEANAADIAHGISWEAGGHTIPCNLLPQSEGFYQPLGLNSTLHSGYNHVGSDDEINVAASSHNINGFIPGWML